MLTHKYEDCYGKKLGQIPKKVPQEILSYRGQVQRRLPLLVLHSGIGSMGEQQRAELSPPFLGRFVQGSKCPLVGCIDTRVVLDQQSSYVHVLDRGEEVAGRHKEEETGKRRREIKTAENESRWVRRCLGEARAARIKAFNKSKCVKCCWMSATKLRSGGKKHVKTDCRIVWNRKRVNY